MELRTPFGSRASGDESEKYADLQNSILVAGEMVNDGPSPNEFYVGMKINKVFCTNTSVVIGEEEFP